MVTNAEVLRYTRSLNGQGDILDFIAATLCEDERLFASYKLLLDVDTAGDVELVVYDRSEKQGVPRKTSVVRRFGEDHQDQYYVRSNKGEWSEVDNVVWVIAMYKWMLDTQRFDVGAGERGIAG